MFSKGPKYWVRDIKLIFCLQVWSFDGSVTCYQVAQLGLFIVTILVLALGILAIFAAADMVYQKEISKWKVSHGVWVWVCVCV